MSDYDCNKFLYSGAVVLLFFACQPYSSAAKTQATAKPPSTHVLSEIEIVEKLRAAKVVDPTYSLSAKKTSEEVVVTTGLNPKFNDNDTKVQSVLIAKTAFGLIPATVQRVKVVFKSEHGDQSKIVVNRLLVMSFGEGKTDETTMLKSLDIDKETAEAPSDDRSQELEVQKVVGGPLAPERQLQLGNIEFLKEKGVDVKAVEHLFAAQEKNAGAGDKGSVSKSLREINTMISALKDQWKKAQASEDTLLRRRARIDASPAPSGPKSSSNTNDSSSRPDKQGKLKLELAALTAFLAKQHVNVTDEVNQMHYAQENGTNDHTFRVAMKWKLLDKFYKLPLNIQKPFMDRHPFLFGRDDTTSNTKKLSPPNGPPASKSNLNPPPRPLPYTAR